LNKVHPLEHTRWCLLKRPGNLTTKQAGCLRGLLRLNLRAARAYILNTKVKLVTRKAFGYRKADTIKIALFHALGRLPEPDGAHRFC
jgi:hypothetical protein